MRARMPNNKERARVFVHGRKQGQHAGSILAQGPMLHGASYCTKRDFTRGAM